MLSLPVCNFVGKFLCSKSYSAFTRCKAYKLVMITINIQSPNQSTNTRSSLLAKSLLIRDPRLSSTAFLTAVVEANSKHDLTYHDKIGVVLSEGGIRILRNQSVCMLVGRNSFKNKFAFCSNHIFTYK